MERLYEIAKTLTALPGVSGDEDRSIDGLKAVTSDLFDTTGVTSVSSFYGIRKSKNPNAKTVLLDAHLDTVGFIVTQIGEGGFLKVAPVGGIAEKNLSASEVWIYGKKTIPGVFASKPPHLQERGESEKKMSLSDMSIDTGLSKESLEEIVRIGTFIGYKADCEKLVHFSAVSPYFDDRICVAAFVRALELVRGEDLNVNVAFQCSSREETNGAGAPTTAFRLHPDYAIVMDVCHGYTPESPEYRKTSYCGKGCTISYSPETNRTFTEAMVELAATEKIPVQFLAEATGTGTNSRSIQTSHGGIPVCLISIPLKNMHTANEIADLRDAKAAADLVAAFLRKLPYNGKEED